MGAVLDWADGSVGFGVEEIVTIFAAVSTNIGREIVYQQKKQLLGKFVPTDRRSNRKQKHKQEASNANMFKKSQQTMQRRSCAANCKQ